MAMHLLHYIREVEAYLVWRLQNLQVSIGALFCIWHSYHYQYRIHATSFMSSVIWIPPTQCGRQASKAPLKKSIFLILRDQTISKREASKRKKNRRILVVKGETVAHFLQKQPHSNSKPNQRMCHCKKVVSHANAKALQLWAYLFGPTPFFRARITHTLSRLIWELFGEVVALYICMMHGKYELSYLQSPK